MNLLKKHPAQSIGVFITVCFLLTGIFRLEFLDMLELKFYDLKINLKSDPTPPEEIVIVDIDDSSIEKLGRWPWPRSLIAKGIHKINAANPGVIGLNIIYSEPEEHSGPDELSKLEILFLKSFPEPSAEPAATLLRALRDARLRLDHDQELASAMQDSGKIVLPVFFKGGVIHEQDKDDQDSLIGPLSLMNVNVPEGSFCPRIAGIILPLPPFLHAGRGIGHINFSSDFDGTTRKEQLIYDYQGLYIPSYALTLLREYLNVKQDQLQVDIGSSIRMKGIEIPMNMDCSMMVNFKGPSNTFKKFSFYDVLNDKISQNVLKNKLVLVSTSAAGIMNPFSAPTDPSMPVGELTANVIWTMLHQQFIHQPSWAIAVELLLILIIGSLLTLVFPGLRALTAGIVFWFLLAGMIGFSIYIFLMNGLWIQIIYPLTQLIVGYIGVISIKYFMTETRKEKVEGESADTNRMLGLSFQSQGMLDMALEKFRKVPVDNEMKDVLYNLALDYERKRQFNKAVSVYEYIEEYDRHFKDIEQKKKKLIRASETMVYGNGFLGGSGSDGDLLLEGSEIKPTLGRYEIIKQLGKGAMGVVYLGKDPRINRTTAIKTYRFANDFDPEEAAAMKAKFFREAESAGTLSHPNIVTIYDAGEEQDLAYIAMEYLDGHDLQAYTKKGNLLPIRKIIDYIADIADGLDYAHERGIVHRDIKPANIMLLKNGMIKITDFGIARITASSQTKTGIVKGTPYYMSPEQISGQKVDGKSDIFSTGVMMFQLLTGKVPFTGDSPASLMHRILNVPHPDPSKLNPRIMKPLVKIINKALEKDPKNRFQKASALAANLRQLGSAIDAMMAKRKTG
ncbi:MAG: serine/threonine-protein kinase [Pseudomonadota bacterium]